MRHIWLLLSIGILLHGAPLSAELATKLVTAYQHGLTYLPLMIMQEQKLLEREATKRGLPQVQVEWRVFAGPAPINDALITGAVQFGAVGVPSLVTLWDKSHRQMRAVSSLACLPMSLNVRDPRLRSLEDFDLRDKIAIPSVKVGVGALLLQMEAARLYGPKNYARFDGLAVSLPHAEAVSALLKEGSGIQAHFAAVPYHQEEIQRGKGQVRTLLNSYQILGGPSSYTVLVASNAFLKEHPKLYEAYLAALEQAMSFIREKPQEAAALYQHVTGSKESGASIEKLLTDPDHIFDTTPRKIIDYARFMHQVGSIKDEPASWKDLVHPNLFSKAGAS